MKPPDLLASLLRLAPLLLGMLPLACAGEAPDPDVLLAQISACGGRELEPCDILDPACQRRLAEIAACQWGGPGTPALLPDVTTRSEDEYRALLTRASGSQSAPRTAVDTTLALLGLIDRGDLAVQALVDRTADLVLAYYDFQSKAITLIARETAADLALADSTLLHELIHAQQDAAHDLSALQRQGASSTDGTAATQALYEGEAEFQQWLFETQLARAKLDAEFVDASLQRRRVQTEESVFAAPSVFSSSLQLLPYSYGPVWLNALWQDGGRAAVEEHYANPSTDLLPVLQAAWGAEEEAPALRAYPAVNVYYRGERPPPDSELIPISLDRLGAYSLYIAARIAGDATTGQQLALAWRGDQLDVYQLAAGGAAARWQAHFDAEAPASAFSELMQRNPDVTVRQAGSSVVCVVSESGEKPEWLFGPLGAI